MAGRVHQWGELLARQLLVHEDELLACASAAAPGNEAYVFLAGPQATYGRKLNTPIVHSLKTAWIDLQVYIL